MSDYCCLNTYFFSIKLFNMMLEDLEKELELNQWR